MTSDDSASVGDLLIADTKNSRPEKVIPAETSISLLFPAQQLGRFSSTKAPTAMLAGLNARQVRAVQLPLEIAGCRDSTKSRSSLFGTHFY